mgnify:CR=1 FL=1
MRINGKTPREILKFSSIRDFLEWLPQSSIQILVLLLFALTAIAPVYVSIKALSYLKPQFFIGGEINQYYIRDFYTNDYDKFMHGFVFPCVWIFSAAAYLLSFYKSHPDRTLSIMKQHRNTALAFFGMLIIWLVINVFLINGPTTNALHGSLPNHENLLLYLEYYLCFFPLGFLLTNAEKKRRILAFFALVSAVLVPFAVYLHPKVFTKDAIVAVFPNSNYYGIYLGIFLSLCISMTAGETVSRRRWFFTAILLIDTIVLYFNNTFGAWVGVFFACLFSIVAFRIRDGRFNRRALLVLVLFLGCLILCGLIDAAFISGKNNFTRNLLTLFRDILNIKTDPNSSAAAHAGSGRWKIWKYYLSVIREHPWFGIGLDGVRALDIGQSIKQNSPHNEYLQYATFLGIPGLILYFSACLSVFIRAIKYRKHLDNLTLAALTAAFGYLVGAFFGNTRYSTTPYLYIMLGLGYVHTDGAAE